MSDLAHRDLFFRLDDTIRWLEAVLAHPKSTDFDVSLAVAISSATDRASGRCIRSQKWLAKATRKTERAVRKGTERMVANGLLLIDRTENHDERAIFGAAKRGMANVYHPLSPPRPAPKPGTHVPPYSSKAGTGVPHSTSKTRNGSTENPEPTFLPIHILPNLIPREGVAVRNPEASSKRSTSTLIGLTAIDPRLAMVVLELPMGLPMMVG